MTQKHSWGWDTEVLKIAYFYIGVFPNYRVAERMHVFPVPLFPSQSVLLNYMALWPLPIVPEIFLIVKQCHVQATIWVSNSSTKHCHGHRRGRLSLALGNNKCLSSGNYALFCVNFERHFAGACYCGAPGEMQPCQNIMPIFNTEEIDHSLKQHQRQF